MGNIDQNWKNTVAVALKVLVENHKKITHVKDHLVLSKDNELTPKWPPIATCKLTI
jgi:hypothetical protein